MRKFLTLILAYLVAFQSFGILVFYWGGIQLCKITFKESLESQHNADLKLTAFSSNDKNFELINDDEVLFNGEMYDIVKTEHHQGKLIYFALSDKKEDQYINGLFAFNRENTQNRSLPEKNINSKIFKFAIEIKYQDLNIINASRPTSDPKPGYAHFSVQSPFLEIFSPPPNSFIS